MTEQDSPEVTFTFGWSRDDDAKLFVARARPDLLAMLRERQIYVAVVSATILYTAYLTFAESAFLQEYMMLFGIGISVVIIGKFIQWFQDHRPETLQARNSRRLFGDVPDAAYGNCEVSFSRLGIQRKTAGLESKISWAMITSVEVVAGYLLFMCGNTNPLFAIPVDELPDNIDLPKLVEELRCNAIDHKKL